MGMRDTVKRIGLHAGVRFFQAKAVWRDNWVIKEIASPYKEEESEYEVSTV